MATEHALLTEYADPFWLEDASTLWLESYPPGYSHTFTGIAGASHVTLDPSCVLLEPAVYFDGVRMTHGVDFMWSGNTITFSYKIENDETVILVSESGAFELAAPLCQAASLETIWGP